MTYGVAEILHPRCRTASTSVDPGTQGCASCQKLPLKSQRESAETAEDTCGELFVCLFIVSSCHGHIIQSALGQIQLPSGIAAELKLSDLGFEHWP